MTGRCEFPILDLEDPPGRFAASLRDALEQVGFYALVNHGVDGRLVRAVYDAAERFHALPEATRRSLAVAAGHGGYLRLGGSTSYTSRIAGEVRKPNLVAGFFVHRDRPEDDPLARSGAPLLRMRNRWPPETALPGLRATLLEYTSALEALGRRLLPRYAAALELPTDHFDASFAEAHYTLKLAHYPVLPHDEHQWGLAPHTDAGFLTLLPDNDTPGLEIRPPGGEWHAPPRCPGAFIVNSGETLKRWTNDRFLATEHRVRNDSGRDRYSVPFFYDPDPRATIACLPTCTGPDRPPRHDPITFGDYWQWYVGANFGGDRVRTGGASTRVRDTR